MELLGSHKDYYRKLKEIDIGRVARDLLPGRITNETTKELQCDCPHHASQSHRSLHIMLDKQMWHCFGCGKSGDVLQLVEFVQSGQVTTGASGKMPESHQQARDYLAGQAGLPQLSRIGLSNEEIAQREEEQRKEMRTFAALTELAAYYHARLKKRPEVMRWIEEHYQISEQMIDELKIGYAPWHDKIEPDDPGAYAFLTKGGSQFSGAEVFSTGALIHTEGRRFPLFQNRVVFPYWSQGSVVYMIARKTPWTAENHYEKAKYKKLMTHGRGHEYVSPCISNDYLYNEDCLLAKPRGVIITEGITDCISLMQHGFAAVSPGTVRIKETDWDRMISKLSGISAVYLCLDNEISEVGINAALGMSARFASEHIDTRIIVLPTGEKQQKARAELSERWGIRCAGDLIPGELGDRRASEDVTRIQCLLGEAKIDVNEYFVQGHTRGDFQSLIDAAVAPLCYSIERIPVDGDKSERNKLLDPVLRRVARETSLEQKNYLEMIKERFGISLTDLRSRVREIEKEIHTASRRSTSRKLPVVHDAEEGSCKAAVNQALVDSDLAYGSPDFITAADAAYEWFLDNGAKFYHTNQREPYMFFGDRVYWMDPSDRARKREFQAFLFKETGQVQTTQGGRTIMEVLVNRAAERGITKDPYTWLHSDVPKHTIYFALNNQEGEIAKITPEGIEILKNGGNSDEILLSASRKMQPIHYLPDADVELADRLLKELIIDSLTCPKPLRFFVTAWVMCFPLLDFTGTKPMTRFEGGSQSGKTTASKLLTTLLYGEYQQKKSTIAANYSDGASNPLLSLDNIETVNMSDDLMMFLLTTVTGIANEKRKTGTDTETVVERTKCLLNTSGIEPLYGHLDEILSRSFIIRFDRQYRTNDAFLEAEVLAQLKEHRDLILSAIMKKTCQVLALCRDGAHRKVMRLLNATLGDHNKQRCNDYLSLMYLMMLAGGSREAIDEGLSRLDPAFIGQVNALNEVTLETSRESNQIANALATLFSAYEKAMQTDMQSGETTGTRSHVALFREKYAVEINDDGIIGVSANGLFAPLKRLARDYGLSFKYESGHQFALRMANDLEIIRSAGFEITVNPLPQRRRSYDIRRVG